MWFIHKPGTKSNAFNFVGVGQTEGSSLTIEHEISGGRTEVLLAADDMNPVLIFINSVLIPGHMQQCFAPQLIP